MKFIHCGDIHLDSPMQTHMTAGQAAARNAEILQSFLRLTEYAQEKGVRAVLIAGDLFDGDRVRTRTVDTVLGAMECTKEVDYLYLAGNHDGAARAFSDRRLPENLHCIPRQWQTFSFGDVAVSGIEMCRENAESLYDTLPSPEEKTHIVMLHGQVGSAGGEDLVNLNRLKDRGIDYLALGHIHSHCEEKLDNRGTYAYCGCLEGRGFDECGDKGFVLLDVENGKVRTSFVPFSCRKLHRIPVDITGMLKNAQIAQAVREAAGGLPREDMVEFLLRGQVEPTADISVTHLQNGIGTRFFFAKVKNETTLALNPQSYEKDISLKGEFIRLVMAADLPQTRKEAIIHLGLQALAGEEIGL